MFRRIRAWLARTSPLAYCESCDETYAITRLDLMHEWRLDGEWCGLPGRFVGRE